MHVTHHHRVARRAPPTARSPPRCSRRRCTRSSTGAPACGSSSSSARCPTSRSSSASGSGLAKGQLHPRAVPLYNAAAPPAGPLAFAVVAARSCRPATSSARGAWALHIAHRPDRRLRSADARWLPARLSSRPARVRSSPPRGSCSRPRGRRGSRCGGSPSGSASGRRRSTSTCPTRRRSRRRSSARGFEEWAEAFKGETPEELGRAYRALRARPPAPLPADDRAAARPRAADPRRRGARGAADRRRGRRGRGRRARRVGVRPRHDDPRAQRALPARRRPRRRLGGRACARSGDDPPMRRFNVFAPEFTYDDSRPEGYKAGSVRLSPVIGASRMVATVYELPPGESTWPYHYEYGAEEWALVLAGTADAAPSRRRGRARAGRRRLLPRRPRRRAQVHQPRRRDGAADDHLDLRAPGRRRLPRQRQARRLARRRRARDRAPRARRLLGGRDASPSSAAA